VHQAGVDVAAQIVGAERMGVVGGAEAARESDRIRIDGNHGRHERDQSDDRHVNQRSDGELAALEASPDHSRPPNRILGSANAYSTSATRLASSVATAVATVSPRTVG